MQLLSRHARHVLCGIAIALSAAAPARAGQTNVGVAANFTDAATEITAAFKENTGHEAVLCLANTAPRVRRSACASEPRT